MVVDLLIWVVLAMTFAAEVWAAKMLAEEEVHGGGI